MSGRALAGSNFVQPTLNSIHQSQINTLSTLTVTYYNGNKITEVIQ